MVNLSSLYIKLKWETWTFLRFGCFLCPFLMKSVSSLRFSLLRTHPLRNHWKIVGEKNSGFEQKGGGGERRLARVISEVGFVWGGHNYNLFKLDVFRRQSVQFSYTFPLTISSSNPDYSVDNQCVCWGCLLPVLQRDLYLSL